MFLLWVYIEIRFFIVTRTSFLFSFPTNHNNNVLGKLVIRDLNNLVI